MTVVLGLLLGWRSDPAHAAPPTGFELLGRGVNYGNMLEAPQEGEWGARFDDAYPGLVKQAGFEHVRVPVCWSAHTANDAPFAIEPEFLSRVKHVVEANLAAGLKVVLNVHHFEELFTDPAGQRARFLAIWQQVATAFPPHERLFLELLNEPHGKLGAELWNPLLADTLAVIRQHHPQTWVVVGPDRMNGMHRLPQLQLPDDERLIVTVHYYLPFEFTHQGADFIKPALRAGKKWQGTEAEMRTMHRPFAAATDWAKEHRRPIYLGEFGAIDRADPESRVRWTRQVRRECETAGFAWGYWELAAGFGILNPQTQQWQAELLQALVD